MESLIASRTLNRGADNVFTNASTSGSNTYSLNNIERVDYILDSPSALDVNQSGFTVFDRGGNDAFAVAVILGASGSAPTAYSNIIRVSASAFGAAPSGYNGNVTYRVYKGVPGTDLAESGRGDNNTQSMRGLYFKFSDFGIPAGTTIYGYSILPGDIPATATPAQIVNYQDAAIYPTNTLQNGGGGLDLVSVSGIFVNQALPVNFGAIKCNIVNKELIINWQTLKENNNQYFDVEVSADGVAFKRIARINSKATNGDSTSMLEYSYSTSISNVNGIVLGVASFLLLFAFSILGERRRRLTYFVPALLLCTILTGMYSCHKKDDRLNDSQKNIFVRIAQVDIDGNHFYSKVVKAIAE